jgi:hypothetical protein
MIAQSDLGQSALLHSFLVVWRVGENFKTQKLKLRWLASSKGRLAYGRPESGAKFPKSSVKIRSWSRLILTEGRDWNFVSDSVVTRERN